MGLGMSYGNNGLWRHPLLSNPLFLFMVLCIYDLFMCLYIHMCYSMYSCVCVYACVSTAISGSSPQQVSLHPSRVQLTPASGQTTAADGSGLHQVQPTAR